MQKVLIFDSLSIVNEQIRLKKENQQLDVIGIVMGNGNQSINININTDFLAPKTGCKLDFRIILKDRAGCNFNGLIKIAKNAHEAKAFLNVKALLLSKNCQAKISPLLEIEANDVSAGHATAVGKLDQDQIYYLTSRGLTKIKAENLIIESFLSEITAKIEDDKIRQATARKVKKFLKI